MEVLSLLVCE